MPFRYYNAHPYNRLVDDCVKRSIALTTGISYKDVKKGLNEHKKITGAKAFNEKGNPGSYMENALGFPRTIAQKRSDGTRETVEEFARSHPKGRYVVSVVGHWTACIDGIIYDTWDCSKEKVNFAYEIATEPYTMPDLKKQVFKYCCTSEKISDTETRIRIYDGLGTFAERKIPTDLTKGYVLCLQHSNYQYIDLDGGKENEG